MQTPPPAMDPVVLARLTGRLGDKASVARLSTGLGQALAETLPGLLESEFGLPVEVSHAGFETGRHGPMIDGLGGAMVLGEASLAGWCERFTIACGSPLIIALVETMLGAEELPAEAPAARPLSRIELDIAAMLFARIAGALAAAVGGSHAPELAPALNADSRKPAEDGSEEAFATAVTLAIGVGPVRAEVSLVVPQSALLKTAIVAQKPAPAAVTRAEWSERLGEQVRRARVTLEARIRLEPQTLGIVSRLQAGDVIPFDDAGEVRVEVNANGRDLYVCELGRSGNRYMVRVRDTCGSKDELIRHLTR